MLHSQNNDKRSCHPIIKLRALLLQDKPRWEQPPRANQRWNGLPLDALVWGFYPRLDGLCRSHILKTLHAMRSKIQPCSCRVLVVDVLSLVPRVSETVLTP
jgi:hypothetical protein